MCRDSLQLGSLGSLALESLGAQTESSLSLEAHNTPTPLAAVSGGRVLVLDVEVGDELIELGLVLLVHIGESKSSGGLAVHHLTQTSLALDNAIRNLHLAAQSRKPDHQLNGVNIVGNDNKLGLLLLDESGDVVQAELDDLAEVENQ